MPIISKTKRTAAIYNRGREVVKVYDHGTLAWQKQSSIPDYLCFTALEAGQFTLTIPAAVTPTYLSYVEWSKDGRTWNHTDNTSEAVTIDVQVAQGEKVYWRGSGNRCTADSTAATSALNVSSDARFDASGHLLSILKGGDYENVSGVQRYTFCNLFYQNTALVHAHDLVLPPVGLTGVFFQLFRGCSSLVSPPASIPLTTIPAWGCRGMYYDCSSLITPTDLIATTYGNTACTFMYRGCASLTRIATLPTVTSLVDSAQFQQMYYGCTSLTRAELYTVTAPFKKQLFSAMFYRCTNLNYIKCLYTDLSADQAFTDWLNGVSSTGTFIQAEGVEWPRGASGIPTGWVDVEKRTMPSGYKQLLQVTSNGTAYIQLSFGFEETDEVAATFSVDTSQRTDKYIVCPQTWNNKNNRYGMGVHNSGRYTAAFGNRSTSNTMLTPNTYNDGELHNWTYAAATFAVADKSCSINITGYTFGGITTNLRLFYGYNSNTKGAISSYKHIKGSTTACDFVAAVRESDNTAGLYDLANDEFMTCNGLTAGEEI